MEDNSKGFLFGGVDKNQQGGFHICHVYNNEKDRRHVMSKFIKSGLIDDDKVFYFTDQMSKDDVFTWLKEDGINFDDIDDDKLNVLESYKTYCPHGNFDPDYMVGNLKQLYKTHEDCGQKLIKVCGEASWALNDVPGSDRLIEYEALVNNVVDNCQLSAMCEYDANKFDGNTILDCLKVHNFMIIHGQVVRNPFYMRPEEFIKELRARK
jgi:hypothetical protein